MIPNEQYQHAVGLHDTSCELALIITFKIQEMLKSKHIVSQHSETTGRCCYTLHTHLHAMHENHINAWHSPAWYLLPLQVLCHTFEVAMH